MLRGLLATLLLAGVGCGSASSLDVVPGEGAQAAFAGSGAPGASTVGGAPAAPGDLAGVGGGTVDGILPVDSGIDPFLASAACTSGTSWASGNRGSPVMHPGLPCISCHRGGGPPAFLIAGTVYPTAHEPNECNGSLPGVQASVVITGADGVMLTLPVNSVGNFYASQPVALPFRAKVVLAGAERAMSTPQTRGDCNSCHTQTGANGAPGRIVLP